MSISRILAIVAITLMISSPVIAYVPPAETPVNGETLGEDVSETAQTEKGDFGRGVSEGGREAGGGRGGRP